MNVILKGDSQRLVEEQLQTGRYPTAEDVVLAGLDLLRRRQAKLANLRAKIAVGLDQARRGELVDGEEVFDEIFGPLKDARDVPTILGRWPQD